MKKNSILLLSVLVLSACGGEEQSTQGQAELYEMQHLPKKNSIVVPKSLLGPQESASEQSLHTIESNGETDSAFAKVNHRVIEAEASRLSNQVPLLMLDAVWPEIQSYCKNIALGAACTIPKDTITLQLTDDIVAAAEAVAEKVVVINNQQQSGVVFETSDSSGATQLSITSGDYIRLGTLVYSAFSAEKEFQHEVSLDFSEMEKINGLGNDDATILMLKWATNERSVVSTYRFENSDSKYVYTYSYINDDAEEVVTIQYSGTDNSPENLPSTYIEIITLKTLDGSNSATLVGFEWRRSGGLGVQSFSAEGEANNDYGSLEADFSSDYNSEGETEMVSYSQSEIFDSNGTVINSSVCEENCNNEAEWVSGDATNASGNTNTINGDKNEVTITVTETNTESPLIDIVVSGLEDGAYFIALDGYDGGFNRLGYGLVTDGVAEFSYWGSEAELESAKVYTFRLIKDETGYRPGYIVMNTAQITLTE